jgi:hypothetical protein
MKSVITGQLDSNHTLKHSGASLLKVFQPRPVPENLLKYLALLDPFPNLPCPGLTSLSVYR